MEVLLVIGIALGLILSMLSLMRKDFFSKDSLTILLFSIIISLIPFYYRYGNQFINKISTVDAYNSLQIFILFFILYCIVFFPGRIRSHLTRLQTITGILLLIIVLALQRLFVMNEMDLAYLITGILFIIGLFVYVIGNIFGTPKDGNLRVMNAAGGALIYVVMLTFAAFYHISFISYEEAKNPFLYMYEGVLLGYLIFIPLVVLFGVVAFFSNIGVRKSQGAKMLQYSGKLFMTYMEKDYHELVISRKATLTIIFISILALTIGILIGFEPFVLFLSIALVVNLIENYLVSRNPTTFK